MTVTLTKAMVSRVHPCLAHRAASPELCSLEHSEDHRRPNKFGNCSKLYVLLEGLQQILVF